MSTSRSRLTIVGIVAIALFGALFARLWFLQVANTKTYAAQTERNRIRVVREPAVRGAILDDKGRPLVQNTVVDALTVSRRITPEQKDVSFPRLAYLLALPMGELDKRFNDPRYSPYAPVPVDEDVSFNQLVYVREHPELFPGVSATQLTVREYPTPRLPNGAPPGAHIIGYLGSINKHEKRIHKGEDYGPIDDIGKIGAESVFESALRGVPGQRRLEVDALGRLVRVDKEIPSIPGDTVRTTLDLDIQRVAEESLQNMMQIISGQRISSIRSRFATYSPKAGAVVVLDANDGSIKALASAPTFNLDELARGNVPAFLLQPDANYPFVNRALQGQYPIGSTMKPFTAIAALEAGIITPDTTYNDSTGCLILDKGKSTEQHFCNAQKQPHGYPKLAEALRVSSDVYFYNVGYNFYQKAYRKGDTTRGNHIQDVARRFGFGTATGSGIADEAQGRIPDATWKKRFALANRGDATAQTWLPGDIMNLAVGQGDMTATPIQLASAYAALANGGTLWAPRLGAAVLTVDENGQTRLAHEIPARKIRDVGLFGPIRDSIVPALENVVCTEGGTAFGAFEGYHCGDAAGKTGTAQVGKDKADNALFCGWTPVQPSPDPAVHQYVVCVVIEGAGYGGSSAAPVARRVMDAIRDCMPRDTDSLTAAPCNPPPVHYVPTNIQKD